MLWLNLSRPRCANYKISKALRDDKGTGLRMAHGLPSCSSAPGKYNALLVYGVCNDESIVARLKADEVHISGAVISGHVRQNK